LAALLECFKLINRLYFFEILRERELKLPLITGNFIPDIQGGHSMNAVHDLIGGMGVQTHKHGGLFNFKVLKLAFNTWKLIMPIYNTICHKLSSTGDLCPL